MRGRVNPLGLYDLDRRIRPVGTAYRKIVHEWGDVLPTQSICLRVPVYSPSESLSGFDARDRLAALLREDDLSTAPANAEGG